MTKSIEETAQALGVDERTVRAWIAKGELKAINLSRNALSQKPRLRIRDVDLERFLELRAVSTAPTVRRRKLTVTGRWNLCCGLRAGNGPDRSWC
jgi:excisionase family DNA binding protein